MTETKEIDREGLIHIAKAILKSIGDFEDKSEDYILGCIHGLLEMKQFKRGIE